MALDVRIELHDDATPKLCQGECLNKSWNNIILNVDGELFGNGSLYLGTVRLYWISKENPCQINFGVNYQTIILHAISRDKNQFSEPSLYCHFDIDFCLKECLHDGQLSYDRKEASSSDSDDPFTEVRFVPMDSSVLMPIFKGISEMSSLCPDAAEEFERSSMDSSEDSGSWSLDEGDIDGRLVSEALLDSGSWVQDRLLADVQDNRLDKIDSGVEKDVQDETDSDLEALDLFFSRVENKIQHEWLKDEELLYLWDVGDKWEEALMCPSWSLHGGVYDMETLDSGRLMSGLIENDALKDASIKQNTTKGLCQNAQCAMCPMHSSNVRVVCEVLSRYLEKKKIEMKRDVELYEQSISVYNNGREERLSCGMKCLMEWKNLLDQLNQLADVIFVDDSYEAMDKMLSILSQLYKLFFQKLYVEKFVRCNDLLNEVQQGLYTQDSLNYIKPLKELDNLLSHQCRVESVWLFDGMSKDYLVRRLDLMLRSLSHKIVSVVQNAMEVLDFGGLEFEKHLKHFPEPRKVELAQSLNHLTLYQFHYQHFNSLKGVTSVASLYSYWLSFALASFVLIRFDLLFIEPSSQLCRLTYIKEPIRHMSNIFLTHLPFLEKYLVPCRKPDYVKDVMCQFCRLLCHRLQLFCVNRCSVLKSVYFEERSMVSKEEIDFFWRVTLTETLKLAGVLESLKMESCLEALFSPEDSPEIEFSSYLMEQSCFEQYCEMLKIHEKESHPSGEGSGEPVEEETPTHQGSRTMLPYISKRMGESYNCKSKSQHLSLFSLLCSGHREDMMNFWSSLDTLPLAECSETVSFSSKRDQDVKSSQNVCVEITKVKTSLEGCQGMISKRAALFIEGMYLMFHNVQVLKHSSKLLQNYSEYVFGPLLRTVRNAYRDAWNGLDCPVAQVETSCLIVETCQGIVNCLNDPNKFLPASYLTVEMDEWQRLLCLMRQIFTKTLLEKMGFPNLPNVLAYVGEHENASESLEKECETKWVKIISSTP